MKGIYFLSGIHGVGKTTLCDYVSKRTGISHFTASALIRRQREDAVPRAGKMVGDVASNQTLLLAALAKSKERATGILLDGHATLQTPKGIEGIAGSVFQAMNLRGIGIVLVSPIFIRERLLNRDQVAPKLEEIAFHQQRELEATESVSRALSLPLDRFADGEGERLISAVVRALA